MKRTSNFFWMEKKEVVMTEMSFGGKRCHVKFFNSFICSSMTKNHSDTVPQNMRLFIVKL